MAAEASRETLSDTAVIDMSTSPTVTVGTLPLTEDKDGGMNFNSVKLSINTPSPSQVGLSILHENIRKII